MRTPWVVAAVVGGLGGLGCPRVDPYVCSADSQCILEQAVGVCDPREGRCAYPDGVCPSGYRFPAHTDRGLADECTEPGTATSSSSSSSDDGGSGSGMLVPTEGSSSSASSGDACTLVPAEPLELDVDSYAGPIERLVIDAVDRPAIRIVGVPNAVIRDLEISFSGAPGILVEDSPGLTIERVRLVNAGAPEGMGPAGIAEYGIQVARSPGTAIRHVRVLEPLTGIQVEDSDDLLIEYVIVENARGQPVDTGGDGVLVQTSSRVAVEHFACINDGNMGVAHAGVFIDRCTDAIVRDGTVTETLHQSGAGVRVHTADGQGNVRVEHVDVTGGNHACFNVRYGYEVVLENTGCREQPDFGWVVNAKSPGPVSVIGGWYYAVGTPQCCTELAEFSATEQQETANIPPTVDPPCAE